MTKSLHRAERAVLRAVLEVDAIRSRKNFDATTLRFLNAVDRLDDAVDELRAARRAKQSSRKGKGK